MELTKADKTSITKAVQFIGETKFLPLNPSYQYRGKCRVLGVHITTDIDGVLDIKLQVKMLSDNTISPVLMVHYSDLKDIVKQ